MRFQKGLPFFHETGRKFRTYQEALNAAENAARLRKQQGYDKLYPLTLYIMELQKDGRSVTFLPSSPDLVNT